MGCLQSAEDAGRAAGCLVKTGKHFAKRLVVLFARRSVSRSTGDHDEVVDKTETREGRKMPLKRLSRSTWIVNVGTRRGLVEGKSQGWRLQLCCLSMIGRVGWPLFVSVVNAERRRN